MDDGVGDRRAILISLITLGSPDQVTGGYLYHQRMADAAPAHGARLRFASVSPRLPFPLPALDGWSALARALPADVVVVDSIAAAYVAPALAARGIRSSRSPPPLAASLHQPPGGVGHGRGRTRVQAVLDRSLYRRADRLIVASQSLAEELAARGLPEPAMRVVPPGRDLPSPPDSPLPDLRQGRRIALLSVGNWVPHKGLLDLLEVLARLPTGTATLHLVGRDDADPSYTALVRVRLASPELTGRVVVHGPLSRERLAVLYRSADVFVLPSRQEAYGTVYGEAMAAGLPVAGWRAGNLANLATDGREGVVVEPGDIDALTTGLRRLADDEVLRARMAAAAAARSEALPTWEESAAVFFGTLRELAGLGSGSPR